MASKLTELSPEKQAEAAPQSPRGLAARWQDPRFRLTVWAGAAALFLLSIAAWAYYRNRVTTDDAQVDGHIVPVASKIYGNVAEVLARDNEPVKAGQVLVRLDARDYQARADQAKAALALAESRAQAAEISVPWTAETTRSGSSDAEAQFGAADAEYERAQIAYHQASTAGLAYARASLARRQAEFDRAKADEERMKPLAAKQEISRQQYDAYLAAARVAGSELAAAQENLATAQQEVGMRRAAMQSAKARVAQARAAVVAAQANHRQVKIRRAEAASALAAVAEARANLAAAELNLNYTTLVAPVDGIVTRKSVEVGEILQPGQGVLVLIPLHDIWVTANFKETQLARVRPGQKAEIRVDMYGKTFTGHVDSIAGATGARLSLLPPENATGNFVKVVERIPVKILLDPIPPEQAVLRPGMNVEATIITR